jgi:hypothetical protein
LLRHLAEQPVPPSLTISRRISEEDREKIPSLHLTMTPSLDMFESLRWTLVAMYLCITSGICLLLVFHVHIHRPLPHELRWGSEESTMYLLPYLNSRCREV